jgi:hypothetical protein
MTPDDVAEWDTSRNKWLVWGSRLSSLDRVIMLGESFDK